MRVKKLTFYGYHPKNQSTAFRPLPRGEQIQGDVLLELFAVNEEIPIRFGGYSAEAVDSLKGKIKLWKPEIEIIIDNNKIEL